MSELLVEYTNLEQRLAEALEFTQFADMLPELEHEVREIESLLEKISIYAYLMSEEDYYGAFVTIRGEYRDWPDYLPDYEPENLLEEACIRAITTFLSSSFMSERVYTSAEMYRTEGIRPPKQEEVILWIKDTFAYGILKHLTGQYLLFGKHRVVALALEVLPVLPQGLPSSELGNCHIRVFRSQWAHSWTDNVVEIEHLPSKIKVCSNGEKSQLLNKVHASQIIHSRLYQASKANQQDNTRYSYIWVERLIIDHCRKQRFPFSEAREISRLLIRQLESIPEFLAE